MDKNLVAWLEAERDYLDSKLQVNVLNMYKSIPKDKWYKDYTDGSIKYLYCGRPSILGNPIKDGTLEDKIRKHKIYWNMLDNTSKPKQLLLDIVNNKTIKTLNLVCFCKPKDCHCDHIKDWVGKQ